MPEYAESGTPIVLAVGIVFESVTGRAYQKLYQYQKLTYR